MNFKQRTFFSVCAICMTLISQAANIVGGPFTIKGTAKGADGKEIYLNYSKAGKQVKDFAIIKKGTFIFKGKISEPFVLGTLVMGNSEDRRNQQWYSIMMEPTNMIAVLNMNDFQNSKVTGSKSQDEYNELNASMRKVQKEMNRLHDTINNTKEERIRNAYSAKYDSLELISNRISIDFIKKHPDSYVSSYLMMFYIGKMEYDVAQNCYNAFSAKVRKYGPFIKELEDELANTKLVQPGQPAFNFTATDMNGKQISLYDLKGKYVILDFWASWCVPCRRSFPHVKSLYEKYKDKGLDVFCVGDNDSEPDKWREAIKKDGVEKFHHVLRGMKTSIVNGEYKIDKTNDISEHFAVHYLPTKYLINPEGKIVGKFDDKELDTKLKEIFSF